MTFLPLVYKRDDVPCQKDKKQIICIIRYMHLSKEKGIELLEQMGLSHNEALIYYALLSLGQSSVLDISKTSGVKRTTVYPVLESLQNQGLVRAESVGLKQKFVAEDPERLELVLETYHNNIKRTIPNFHALYTAKDSSSSVKQYTGLRAVKGVYENILATYERGDQCLVIGNVERWQSLDEDFFMRHIEERAKLGVDTRFLFQDSEKARWRKKFDKNFNEEVRILPKEIQLDTHMMLTSKQLVIFQLHKPLVAFVIENKATMEMQRQLFEMLWKYNQG